MTDEQQQQGLPPILQYQSAPELVRMHNEIGHMVADIKSKLRSSVNVRFTDGVQNLLLPLLESMLAYMAVLEASVTGYTEQVVQVQGALQSRDEPHVLVGLDEDSAADLSTALEDVLTQHTAVLAALKAGKVKAAVVEKVQAALTQAGDVVEDLRAAFDDMVLPDEMIERAVVPDDGEERPLEYEPGKEPDPEEEEDFEELDEPLQIGA